MDQNPHKPNFELVQGLVTLTPSREKDGGLTLIKGSHNLVKKFFEETGGIKDEQDSGVGRNGYRYTHSDVEWFLKQLGTEIVKIEAEAGSLILWESRVVHWNASPTGTQERVAVYVCMSPAAFATPEILEQKKAAFKGFNSTTHWPHLCIVSGTQVHLRDGKPETNRRTTPLNPVVLTDQILKLAGVLAY